MKFFLKNWLVYTMLFLVCYDGAWLIMATEEITEYLRIDNLLFVKDIIVSGLVTLCDMSLENFVMSKIDMSRLNWMTILRAFLKICVPIVLIACSLEYIHIFTFYGHFPKGMWINIHMFGLLTLFCSVTHLSMCCCRRILVQQDIITEMRQKVLKTQLNPHFIFNSLSILAGLTRIDPKAAEDFTLRLSDIYRYAVNSIDKELVPVSLALHFIKQYIKILQVRYPDSIVCNVDDMECEKSECVFSLSLQLLVENAVKHNPPTEEDKLTLHIWKEKNCIHVRNNIIDRKRYSIPSNGIGLDNIQERYRLKGYKLPEIYNTGDWFEVKLPIISCS